MDEMEIIEYRAMMQGFIELAGGHAKAVFSYYSELVNSGFTETQALTIICAHGYMPPFHGNGNE